MESETLIFANVAGRRPGVVCMSLDKGMTFDPDGANGDEDEPLTGHIYIGVANIDTMARAFTILDVDTAILARDGLTEMINRALAIA